MAKLTREDRMSIKSLIRKGCSNRHIARLLQVDEATVRYHRHRPAPRLHLSPGRTDKENPRRCSAERPSLGWRRFRRPRSASCSLRDGISGRVSTTLGSIRCSSRCRSRSEGPSFSVLGACTAPMLARRKSGPMTTSTTAFASFLGCTNGAWLDTVPLDTCCSASYQGQGSICLAHLEWGDPAEPCRERRVQVQDPGWRFACGANA